MAEWRYEVNIKPFIYDYQAGRPGFEESRDGMVATLKAAKDYRDEPETMAQNDLFWIVANMAESGCSDELDEHLTELYDWADDNLVRLGP